MALKTKRTKQGLILKNLRTSAKTPSRPIVFDLSHKGDVARLQKLLKSGAIQHVSDHYREQVKELFSIQNPPLVFSLDFESAFKKHYASLTAKKPEHQQGRWVFFPWLSSLVHLLSDDDFQRVRTARNRNLITEEEQKKFYDSTVGIAGLSIGNSVALTLALLGGVKRFKLADFDTLSLSNLNRVPSGVSEIGVPKIKVTARQIYEMNPYAQVELYKEGLNANNIEHFFSGLNLAVDEFDDFPTKYLIREYAQKNKVPLVSGADVGESVVVDIERYDIAPDTKPFHGRLGKIDKESLGSLDKRTIGSFIARLVGLENHSLRILQWSDTLGKPGGVVSFPQLGSTALLNGVAIAYSIRSILIGLPIKNDRFVISLEELALDSSYFTPELLRKQEDEREQFLKKFNL